MLITTSHITALSSFRLITSRYLIKFLLNKFSILSLKKKNILCNLIGTNLSEIYNRFKLKVQIIFVNNATNVYEDN